MTARPLVVGLGNRWRGDDGVGPRVLDQLSTMTGDLPAKVDLVELDGESTRLLDTMDHRDLVVVIDAVRSGEPPGTLHLFEVGDAELPATALVSSHGSGVAHAVGLTAALDRMPDRVLVVGVEIAGSDHGANLSPPVEAAVVPAARLVAEEVRRVSG